MTTLNSIADRYKTGGFSCQQFIKQDDCVACFGCRTLHPLRGRNPDQEYLDYDSRHKEPECIGRVFRNTEETIKRMFDREDEKRKASGISLRRWSHNASVLEAFQGSSTALDLTSLNSLATSATAGWCSQQINNSSNLYLDYICQLNLAVVNTAAGGLDAVFIYIAGSMTSTPPTNTAGNSCNSSTTTGATLTFNSVATTVTGFRTAFVLAYTTTNKWATGGPFTIAQAFNGSLPQYLNWPLVNDAGPTLASSGNSFSVQGTYNTVA